MEIRGNPMPPVTIARDAATRRAIDEVPSARFQGVSFKGFKRPPIQSFRQRLFTAPMMGAVATAKPAVQDSCHAEDGSAEAEFAREVLTANGLDPGGYRLAPLVRRVPACLRALRAGCISTAREILARYPERQELAVNSLLIGTTSFFRDDFVFEEIESRVVPDILSRTANPRVWSVACSEGAELYSVAMLFSPRLLPGHGDFLGTDCRESALKAARAGTYQSRSLEGIPAEVSCRHFISSGDVSRVKHELISRMQWLQGDILRDPAEPGWDLILCRNLAIYLESGAMNVLWQKLTTALKPGGFLVTGRAEKPVVSGLQRVGPCIYRKTT